MLLVNLPATSGFQVLNGCGTLGLALLPLGDGRKLVYHHSWRM